MVGEVIPGFEGFADEVSQYVVLQPEEVTLAQGELLGRGATVSLSNREDGGAVVVYDLGLRVDYQTEPGGVWYRGGILTQMFAYDPFGNLIEAYTLADIALGGQLVPAQPEHFQHA